MAPPPHEKATKGCTPEERKVYSPEERKERKGDGVGHRKLEWTKTSLSNLISLG